MRTLFTKFFVVIIVIFSANLKAGYNANMTGKVTQVLTYTYTDQIYFRLENQPKSHPSCSVDFFSIDASTPEARRQQVLSRLLIAYASGTPINIGYDKEAGCSHGLIRVYRVG